MWTKTLFLQLFENFIGFHLKTCVVQQLYFLKLY